MRINRFPRPSHACRRPTRKGRPGMSGPAMCQLQIRVFTGLPASAFSHRPQGELGDASIASGSRISASAGSSDDDFLRAYHLPDPEPDVQRMVPDM